MDFYKHKFSDKFIYLDRPDSSQPKVSSVRSSNHVDENEEHHFIPTAPSSQIKTWIQKTSQPKTSTSTSSVYKASTEKQSTSSLGKPRFEDNLPHEKRRVPHEEDGVPHVEVRVPRKEDHLHRAEDEVNYSANSMVRYFFLLILPITGDIVVLIQGYSWILILLFGTNVPCIKVF